YSREKSLCIFIVVFESNNVRVGGQLDADFSCNMTQQQDKILPLADSQVVNELSAAQFAELVTRQFALLLVQVIPQIQQCGKIRLVVGKSGMELIGGVTVFFGTFTRGLDG